MLRKTLSGFAALLVSVNSAYAMPAEPAAIIYGVTQSQSFMEVAQEVESASNSFYLRVLGGDEADQAARACQQFSRSKTLLKATWTGPAGETSYFFATPEKASDVYLCK